MPYALDDLGHAVLNQLCDLMCGCDGSIPPAQNAFMSWCEPGVPFWPGELGFATGDLDAGSVHDAFAFSRLVDFVPEPGVAYTHERQQRSLGVDGASRFSSIYGDVLRSARVVNGEISDEERRKIERLAGLLRTTRIVHDVSTGEPRPVTENGPMLKAYNEKRAAYLAAVLRCNGGRVASLGTGGTLEGAASASCVDGAGGAARAGGVDLVERYRSQVESGMAAWISIGYRDEVDQINAYIDQVSGRDLVPWRRSLAEMLDGSVITAGSSARRFHHTTPVPAGFVTGNGWTPHTFGCRVVDAGTHLVRRSWRAGPSSLSGFALAGVGAGGADGAPHPDFAVESFELSLELCPVLISRPWFYPPLLTHRGWTFDQQLSDGGDPPSGRLVGFPETILFARDVRVESADFARAYARYASRAGDRAGFGWGPFWLGGCHFMAGRERHFQAEVDSHGVTVPGVQIVGFVNHQLGKSPNPAPELDQGRFV